MKSLSEIHKENFFIGVEEKTPDYMQEEFLENFLKSQKVNKISIDDEDEWEIILN